MNAAWQQKKEAWRHLREELHNSNLRKDVKMAGKHLPKVRKAAVLSFFWAFICNLETRVREGDRAGLYKHPKTMNLESWKGSEIEARCTPRTRTAYFWKTLNSSTNDRSSFHTFLNARPPRFDPSIAEGIYQWPEDMPLGIQPTIQELTEAIHSLGNGKAVVPDGVSVELFKIPLNGDLTLRRRLFDIVVCISRVGGGAAASGKIPLS